MPYESNILVCDVPDNTAGMPQSGTGEKRSFLSPRASPEHNAPRHLAFLKDF